MGWRLAARATGAPQVAPWLLVPGTEAATGAVVASCLPHRHCHHTRCPGLLIRLVCFRLAAKGHAEPRRLFLDGEGHISAAPHWLPREQVLLLAHNQQLIWGSAAQVIVL